ncbi:MAG: hypothetical protein RDU20_12375 [Desulfomonilaceae bacterium]|nr:hypothetical protein [Desulfomonilaceae bacterium]
MDYKSIDGIVYSRYASSPPVINSDLASQYGIQVPCTIEPSHYSGFTEGRNMKLRMVFAGGKKKITCHAQIDWVEKDRDTGLCMVGFGHLSLTDEEFRVLENFFTDKSDLPLELAESVRDKGREAESVVGTDTAREIMRLKAVNFPVSVIEAIDEHRGSTAFSEYVTKAVRAYIKHEDAGT